MTAEPDALESTTTGWPWRAGNAFRLLDGGEVFFARMLAAIDAARMHILLEMYLVSSGRVAGQFIEALTRARARGVRCCVVFDAFGGLGLAAGDHRWLGESGVELRIFNPLRLRNRLHNFRRELAPGPEPAGLAQAYYQGPRASRRPPLPSPTA